MLKKTAILWIALLVLLLTALPAMAERGDDAKRKSKNGKAEGTIDGISVTVDYGRPGVKERDIWSGLVPYNKVWRTGADEATTITFGSDAMVEGHKLAVGTYSLFTQPTEEQWTVIFNSVAEQWGAYSYDESKDVLRVTVSPRQAEHQELLDFVIEDSAMVLRWDELALPIGIAAVE